MNPFQFSRRQFVEQCALGAFGLTVLPNLKASPSVPTGDGFGKAKRIIFLQVQGGMSHIDTFDPKRGKTQGPGRAIKTKADFQVTEYLPNTAKIADKIQMNSINYLLESIFYKTLKLTPFKFFTSKKLGNLHSI